jgi:phosphatidylglycerol:prolipoprotein diacylglycerol transferase
MLPILSRYGPFFLYSFTVVMGLGVGASIGLAAWQARRHPARLAGWLDGLLAAAGVGLLAGRAAYVGANWDYFQAHPAEAALVWQGGLSYHGALFGGLAGLWLWRRRRPPGATYLEYAALFGPPLAFASFFGWVACWYEGCAYGREAVLGPLAADLPDTYGVYALRYQSQLFGALLSLVIALLLVWRQQRRPGGRNFWLALLLISASRAVVTLFRGDAAPLVGAYRLDTLLELGLALVALLALRPRLRSE